MNCLLLAGELTHLRIIEATGFVLRPPDVVHIETSNSNAIIRVPTSLSTLCESNARHDITVMRAIDSERLFANVSKHFPGMWPPPVDSCVSLFVVRVPCVRCPPVCAYAVMHTDDLLLIWRAVRIKEQIQTAARIRKAHEPGPNIVFMRSVYSMRSEGGRSCVRAILCHDANVDAWMCLHRCACQQRISPYTSPNHAQHNHMSLARCSFVDTTCHPLAQLMSHIIHPSRCPDEKPLSHDGAVIYLRACECVCMDEV